MAYKSVKIAALLCAALACNNVLLVNNSFAAAKCKAEKVALTTATKNSTKAQSALQKLDRAIQTATQRVENSVNAVANNIAQCQQRADNAQLARQRTVNNYIQKRQAYIALLAQATSDLLVCKAQFGLENLGGSIFGNGRSSSQCNSIEQKVHNLPKQITYVELQIQSQEKIANTAYVAALSGCKSKGQAAQKKADRMKIALDKQKASRPAVEAVANAKAAIKDQADANYQACLAVP